MPSPWLLIDSNFLCWRAFHAMGGLSFEGEMTGVLFGVFRDILYLQERFSTDRIAFCFDSRLSDRKVKYPRYKSTRAKRYKSMTGEESDKHNEMRRQLSALRKTHLPAIGFKNVFLQKGKEADDLIACICNEYPRIPKIIVSSDEDLFQLLDPFTNIWNPNKKKLLTAEWFQATFKIEPYRWADVKAIAGCSSDDVAGIKGVGEKTAVKFIRGLTNPDSKAHESIILNLKTVRDNMKLVKLPLPDTKPIKLKKDKVTKQKWNDKAKEFGMDSLHDTVMGTNKNWRGSHAKKKKRTRQGFGL
jgi:5'-3' exonuclease